MNATAAVVCVRRMRHQDAADAAAVHVRAFPGFFLTSLGERFLRGFYTACVEFGGGVALVASRGGRTTGFAVGVVDHQAFHRYLKWRWALRLGLTAIPAILTRPAVVRRFALALFSRGPQLPAAHGALLMSIAVDPAAAQQGTGRRLVEAFSGEMRSRGCREYRLTTDRDGNERVNAFYAAAGMILEEARETAAGRWMNRYVCSLDHAPQPADARTRSGEGAPRQLLDGGG